MSDCECEETCKRAGSLFCTAVAIRGPMLSWNLLEMPHCVCMSVPVNRLIYECACEQVKAKKYAWFPFCSRGTTGLFQVNFAAEEAMCERHKTQTSPVCRLAEDIK